MTDDVLTVTIEGRDYVLTPEQADRIARRMAEREADTSAWHEAGMSLLDFAELAEEGEDR
jgi:hypothetical protein